MSRAVSDDELRAGALENVPSFQQPAIEIDQSVVREQRQAGVFTTHLICANLNVRLIFYWSDQIKRGQARLNHQQVRAFFSAATAGCKCIRSVPHIKLIMTTIAKLRRRIRCVAKWPVKIAGEL